MWTQDKYIKAWNFASATHNGQLVPGTQIPYINHVGLVAMEAMAAIAQGSQVVDSPDLLVLCAVLHHTIEDTSTTFEDIQAKFGDDIAQGVQALSKNPALLSKAEQMRDSILRIKRQPREVSMVKLADRITNLQPPPAHWAVEKVARYKDEAIFILNELGSADSYLAGRLQVKIEKYPNTSS